MNFKISEIKTGILSLLNQIELYKKGILHKELVNYPTLLNLRNLYLIKINILIIDNLLIHFFQNNN